MNAIIRWNPIRELADVHGSLCILGRSAWSQANSQGETIPAPDWVPVVDIAENDVGYLLKLEIPGVREEDVTVTLDKRLLTVSGERKPELAEGVRYLRMERASGSFERAFQLAESVDTGSVEARFRNGVLEIHVAKREDSKPRVIQVKAE